MVRTLPSSLQQGIFMQPFACNGFICVFRRRAVARRGWWRNSRCGIIRCDLPYCVAGSFYVNVVSAYSYHFSSFGAPLF